MQQYNRQQEASDLKRARRPGASTGLSNADARTGVSLSQKVLSIRSIRSTHAASAAAANATVNAAAVLNMNVSGPQALTLNQRKARLEVCRIRPLFAIHFFSARSTHRLSVSFLFPVAGLVGRPPKQAGFNPGERVERFVGEETQAQQSCFCYYRRAHSNKLFFRKCEYWSAPYALK